LPENTAGGQPQFRARSALTNFRKKLYAAQNRVLLVSIKSEILTNVYSQFVEQPFQPFQQ